MNSSLLQSLKKKTRGGRQPKPVTDVREYTGKLELLLDTAQKASTNREISELLDRILEIAQRMTRATASSLLMLDEERKALYFLVAEGEVGSRVRDLNIGLDEGICGWVARNARPVLINNVEEDQRFDHDIDDFTGFVTLSMIAVPLIRSGKVIGVLEVINKEKDGQFDENDLAALAAYSTSDTLILLVSMMATITNNIRLHQIMIDWYKQMFETLIAAIDAKDPYAQGHSRRVKELSVRVARAMKLPSEELQVIELGALLHDIGKIDIHDIVLRKAGPLTDMEMYTMKKHALRGMNLLMEIPFLEKVRDIVLYHHERFDGKGYPNGLKGNAIPLRARIVAAAEAFDTMTTDRAYREKMTVEQALDELKKGSGSQFCPAVVKAFREAFSVVDEAPAAEVPVASQNAGQAPDWAPPVPFGAARREVELVVRAGDDFNALRRFRKRLEQVEYLKILMDSRSEDEGTTFILSMRTGFDLPGLLEQIPEVRSVHDEAGALVVIVETPASHKVFKQGFNLSWRPDQSPEAKES